MTTVFGQRAAMLFVSTAVVGLTDSAQAVFVSPKGLGEVLILPYYTVRNNQVTAFSVVNTSGQRKAVKVRVREGKAGRSVLDINLYLGLTDVWAAAIVPTPGGAALAVEDSSCTTPMIATTLGGSGSVAFTNAHYLGDTDQDDSLDRTREGYIEIIEMGTVNSSFSLGNASFGNAIFKEDLAQPGSCVDIATAWQAGVLPGTNSVTANTGGLSGTVHVVNLAEGTDISYEPTVLDAWNDGSSPGDAALHSAPGSEQPGLDQASPANSDILANRHVITSQWSNGLDPVSAVLMNTYISNEYITDPALLAGTDWVVTFPTRHLHSAKADPRPFYAGSGTSGSCYNAGAMFFGRDGEHPGSSIEFSVMPPPVVVPLCHDVNVIRFGSGSQANALRSSAYPSGLGWTLSDPRLFTNGWMSMALNVVDMADTSGNVTAPQTGTGWAYSGLPVVGFAVIRYGASDGNTLGNYGASFNHKGKLLVGIH